jgi:hypothetical protein
LYSSNVASGPASRSKCRERREFVILGLFSYMFDFHLTISGRQLVKQTMISYT